MKNKQLLPLRVPRSHFRVSQVPRVGIEPTLPARASALQADWRPTARPKAFLLSIQWHGRESNPHPPRFELGRSASWRTVPVV
jgi:hypothetical protein